MYFRLGKDIAVLGRMAVQARAHADHHVGVVKELHRCARRIEARHAGVIFSLVREPGLRPQAGGDQGADALAPASARRPGVRPDRAAPDDDDGLLSTSRMRAAACSTAGRVQGAGAMGLERRGRMIRLVVVPRLLLHVHRAAQHDRTPLRALPCRRRGAPASSANSPVSRRINPVSTPSAKRD